MLNATPPPTPPAAIAQTLARRVWAMTDDRPATLPAVAYDPKTPEATLIQPGRTVGSATCPAPFPGRDWFMARVNAITIVCRVGVSTRRWRAGFTYRVGPRRSLLTIHVRTR